MVILYFSYYLSIQKICSIIYLKYIELSVKRYSNSLGFLQIQNYLEEIYLIPQMSVSPSFLSPISLSPSYSCPSFCLHPQHAVYVSLVATEKYVPEEATITSLDPKCRWSPLKWSSSAVRGGKSAGKQMCLFFEESPLSR